MKTMAHVGKYAKSAVGHMFDHYARSENPKEIVRSNKNIDPTRTYLNYNLAEHQTMNQLDFLHKRLSEVRCQNRKDVNVLCDWVVTVPKNLPENEIKQFFEASYDFLENKYGKENVISAYVHMDETMPHIHFAFIPVTGDKKRASLKVSAKERINRKELRTFHQDLQKYVEHRLGHEVAILNEATKEGNRSIKELQRQSAIEQLQEVKEKASKIVFKAQMEANAIQDSVMALNAEYEAKKAFIDEYNKTSDISMMYPNYVEQKKNFLTGKETVIVPKQKWEQKHVAANEKSYLKKASIALEQRIQQFKDTVSYENLVELHEKIGSLKKDNESLKQEKRLIQDELKESNGAYNRVLKRLDTVLDNISDESKNEFVRTWNKEIDQEKQRHFHRGFER